MITILNSLAHLAVPGAPCDTKKAVTQGPPGTAMAAQEGLEFRVSLANPAVPGVLCVTAFYPSLKSS